MSGGLFILDGNDVILTAQRTATVRERIIGAIAAALAGVTPAGAAVYRSHRLVREQDAQPAIVVVPVRESVPDGQRGHHLTHLFTVRVSVYARGDVADQAADETCAAVHAALMADETCGGHALRLAPGDTDWIFEDGDIDAVRVDLHYEALYTTRRASLTERP